VVLEGYGVRVDVIGSTFISKKGITSSTFAAVPDVRSQSPRFAQLWPHRHGTDAIFIAVLRRRVAP